MSKDFKMSKYISKEDMYRDMASHYKEKCEALELKVSRLEEELRDATRISREDLRA